MFIIISLKNLVGSIGLLLKVLLKVLFFDRMNTKVKGASFLGSQIQDKNQAGILFKTAFEHVS